MSSTVVEQSTRGRSQLSELMSGWQLDTRGPQFAQAAREPIERARKCKPRSRRIRDTRSQNVRARLMIFRIQSTLIGTSLGLIIFAAAGGLASTATSKRATNTM